MVRSGQTEASPWLSPARRGQDRELKREAVLRVAARLFNEKALHATSQDDVAWQLNATKPTIHHYFRSKDEVLFECCRMGLEMIEVATPVPGAVFALMEKYAGAMAMDFGMSITRTSDIDLSPENRPALRRLKSQIDQALRGVIANGIDDGSISPCDVGAAAIALWSQPDGPLSPAEIARQTTEFLIAGLALRTLRRRAPAR